MIAANVPVPVAPTTAWVAESDPCVVTCPFLVFYTRQVGTKESSLQGGIELNVGRNRVKFANADKALNVTGYVVGGIPPFDHLQKMHTFVDLSEDDR